MHSRLCFTSVILIISLLLGGCQSTPEATAVISKNDGSFSEKSIISSKSNRAPDETQEVKCSEIFYSTDNSVEFYIDIDTTISNANMPIIEVGPHYFTVADAKRVANVLFGDSVFFEKDPMLAHQYSKQEILDCISRWSQYTNADAVNELFGESNEYIINQIKSKINKFTDLYELSPVVDPHLPCQWTFKNEDAYIYPDEEIDNSPKRTNKAIMATCSINGVTYAYNVVTRNEHDFKLNVINAYLYPKGSPLSIDEAIYRAKLCRTSKPSNDRISEIQAQAEAMLMEMELGDWYIDQCCVQSTDVGNVTEYVICINAVPVIEGVRSIRQPQITNITSEHEYASNYYISDIYFEFSANGDLISFTMTSPLEFSKIINENVQVISLPELLDKAKNHLRNSDSDAYGYGEYFESAGIAVDCIVKIDKIDYALARIKVPDIDNKFYYVPALTMFGKIQYADKKTGDIYYESNGYENLVTLNCVDGTVISL